MARAANATTVRSRSSGARSAWRAAHASGAGAGARGDDRRLAQLQRRGDAAAGARGRRWMMPHGLSVAADEIERLAGDGARGVGQPLAEREVSLAQRRRVAGEERVDGALLLFGIRRGAKVDERDARALAEAVDVDERGVD